MPQSQDTVDSFREVLKEISGLALTVEKMGQKLEHQGDTLDDIRGELHGNVDGSLQTQVKVLKERVDFTSKSLDVEITRRIQLEGDQRSRNFQVVVAVITALVALISSIAMLALEVIMRVK